MTPATILLIVQGLQAAIQAAPQAVEIVKKGKDLIEALFTAKLISKAQQDALWAHMDSISAMARAGIVPPELQVEPDPQV